MILKAVVIGSGSIGALKPPPFDLPDDNENILTHAHAIRYLKEKYILSCIVDIDKKKAMEAAEKWQCNYDDSILNALVCYRPNVLVIATNDESHLSIIKSIYQFSKSSDCFHLPRVVILEKPVGCSLDECLEIKTILDELGIKTCVNYSRMFSRNLLTYKKLIDQNHYGELINVVVRYTRGVHRDGSHAIQLLSNFLGEFIDGKIIDEQCKIIDHSIIDPTYPIHLKFEKCNNVYMIPCDGRSSAVFTIDFWFSKHRIIFEDYGKKTLEYTAAKDGIYGGYDKMKSVPDISIIDHKFTKNLVSMYENIHESFNGECKVNCTIEDAINVWKIIDRLKN